MMHVSTQLVRYGVFELDLTTGELSRNGRKVRLQDQPFRLLSLLLEHPGQTVTRDRLRETLWPADTFVDFDHSLNAAIAKLRQTLGDSADNPRFIETLARRGYRFIAPVEFVGNGDSDAAQAVAEDHPMRQSTEDKGRAAQYIRAGKKIRWLVYTTPALVLLAFALWLWQRLQPGVTELVKLTDDTGLTTSPAISPDGKLLAYASDRGSAGGLNIWVQQLGSGAGSVQLTHDIDAAEPTFSPDGATIAFCSRRNGGGIYVIPVIGGEASRLTPTGRTPRFSPDGQWIAYSAGGSYAVFATADIVGAVY
ncbi:MAG TPA: winged helix-turn-helix domain-containing protein, partial [Bryobacteraceae bacterium]